MTHSFPVLVRSGLGEYERFRREINELFCQSSLFNSHSAGNRYIVPPVNISETDDSWHVQMELPGVKAEDIDISVEDGTLTIKGERKGFEGSEDIKPLRSEISGGSFYKTLTLPRSVDGSKIKAEMKEGILAVTLPRSEEVKPIKIAVNRG